jgi:hypothetical protein
MRIGRGLAAEPHKDPIKKRTTQGQGSRSRPKKGKKLLRGQGR